MQKTKKTRRNVKKVSRDGKIMMTITEIGKQLDKTRR